MKAFVLVQARAGSRPLGASLRAIPGIEWADDLTGAYDAIAVAAAGSMQELFEAVVPRIRDLPGVTRALPAPVLGSVSSPPWGWDEAA